MRSIFYVPGIRCKGQLLTLGLLIAGVLCNAPVLAQFESDDNVDYTEFSLADLMEMDVVYGASKHEQKVNDAPSDITLITAEEIKTYGWRTLCDVLASVRGFYTRNDHSYDMLGTRGFSRSGDWNSRILVMIDGTRLNENIYGSASSGNAFPLDLELIQRVEIIRGPGSSLYGTAAVFGVINIITKDAKSIDGVMLAGKTGTWQTNQGLGLFGKSDLGGSGLDLVVSGSMFASGGQDRYFAEFDYPENNNGVFEDGDKANSDRFFLKASYKDVTLQSVYGSAEKYIPTAPWGCFFNDPTCLTADAFGVTSLRLNTAVAPQWDLMASLSYNTYKYYGYWPYDYSWEGDGSFMVTNYDDAIGQYMTAETQVSYSLENGSVFSAGGEYRDNIKQDQHSYDIEPFWEYMNLETSYDTWGVYGLADWRLTPRVALNLGIRHDYYETFGSTTNPRGALVVKPWQDGVIKALYGSAFRAPNVYELFYYQDTTEVADTNLKPEVINTFEISIEQGIGQNLHGSLSVFNYHNKDLLDYLGGVTYENVGDVKATGFELEVAGRFPNGVRGRASYSYCNAEDQTTESLLDNSPQHMGKLNVMVPIQRPDFSAGIELQHFSRRLTLLNDYTDGYLLTNLTLVKNFVQPGLEISGSVYNLFGTMYYHPGSPELYQDFLLQNGRAFRLMAQIHY